jgi:Uma2 family endonuclease
MTSMPLCYLGDVSRPATVGRMTEVEYLEYDRAHDGKYEYVNGEVVAMAGVSDAHDRIQVNATVGLANRLRGGPCRVRGADLRVRLDETGLYCYPDLTIVCGEPVFAETRPVTLLNPRVIIEVLSDTTEEYDRGAKVAHYRHRATVDLILLIDSQRRMVERQQRNQDGTWTLSEHTSGAISVLDLELPLDELYDGVA